MMKRLIPVSLLCAFLGPAALLSMPGTARAQPAHEASLARADLPDLTPQQRYRSALREAGGGLKIGLEECRALAAGRSTCEAQARARYQDDLAAARALLRDPQARPVNEVGGPIRSSETVTVIRP